MSIDSNKGVGKCNSMDIDGDLLALCSKYRLCHVSDSNECRTFLETEVAVANVP